VIAPRCTRAFVLCPHAFVRCESSLYRCMMIIQRLTLESAAVIAFLFDVEKLSLSHDRRGHALIAAQKRTQTQRGAGLAAGCHLTSRHHQ
jgi:hypothetical protein